MQNIFPRLIAGMLGTLFFGYLFRAPRKTLLLGALLGGLGFLLCETLGESALAFYAASLAISLCGEIAARRMKMPTTVFVSVAVIPIVPGVGLFYTMFYLAQGDYSAAGAQCASAMAAIGAMALGIATSSILARLFSSYIKRIFEGKEV